MTAVSSGIDVVIPTIREAQNIPLPIARLDALRTAHSLNFRRTVVDDNSQAGTDETIKRLNPWAGPIVRTGERGLSSAVLAGLKHAAVDTVVVMDADLSHPPEAISQILSELVSEYDFIVGSRYVEGGSTHHDRGLFRWLNSRVAALLASRVTRPHKQLRCVAPQYLCACGSRVVRRNRRGHHPEFRRVEVRCLQATALSLQRDGRS